jgi:hypothetical protein
MLEAGSLRHAITLAGDVVAVREDIGATTRSTG